VGVNTNLEVGANWQDNFDLRVYRKCSRLLRGLVMIFPQILYTRVGHFPACTSSLFETPIYGLLL